MTVQDFFQNNRLHTAVNCAMMTLIPKPPATKTMKDMRPITCCTTIYKIISKIPTARLSNVITTWWMTVNQHLCLEKPFMITLS